MGRAVPADQHRPEHTTGGELIALGLAPRTQYAPERMVQPETDQPRQMFDHIAANLPTEKEMVAQLNEEEREKVRALREGLHWFLREEGFPHSKDEIIPTLAAMLSGGRDMMDPSDNARTLGPEIITSIFNIPGAFQAIRDVLADYRDGNVDGFTALAGFGFLPLVGPFVKGAGRLARYSRALENSAGFADALADAKAAGLPITRENLYHWSKAPREVIETATQGTGKGGRETERLARLEPDVREMHPKQAYFYTSSTQPPESGLGPFRHDVKDVEVALLDMDEFGPIYDDVVRKMDAGSLYEHEMGPMEKLAFRVRSRLEEMGRPLDNDIKATLIEAFAKDEGWTGLRSGNVATSFYDVLPTRVRPSRAGIRQTLEGSTPKGYTVAERNVMDRTAEGMTSRRFQAGERDGEPWILITAENPRGTNADDKTNLARTAELRKRLDDSGRRYVETRGGYIDEKTGERIQGERGFIVFDVDPIEDALVEGMRYEQNYMLTSDGLIDVKERTIQPARGVRLDAEDAEFYSDIVMDEGGDMRFALDLEDEAQPLFNRRLGEPGSQTEKDELAYLLGSGYDSAVARQMAEMRTQPEFARMDPEDLRAAADERVRKNFRDWFGESKADEVWMHGTTSDFDEIDFAYNADIGFHIGTRGQASARVERRAGNERVLEGVPRVERSLRMTDPGGWGIDAVLDDLTAADRVMGKTGRANDDPYGIAGQFRFGYVDAEELDPSQVAFLRSHGVTPIDKLDGGGKPLNQGGFYDAEDLDALRSDLLMQSREYVREHAPRLGREHGQYDVVRQADNAFIRKMVKDAGFDSIVYKNQYETPTAMHDAGAKVDLSRGKATDGVWGDDGEFYDYEDSYILLDENQFKSVENSGAFGTKDNRFLYGIGGAIAAEEMLRGDDGTAEELGISPNMAAVLFAGTSLPQRRAIVDRLLSTVGHNWNPSITGRGVFDRSLLSGQPLGPQSNFVRLVKPNSRVQASAIEAVGDIAPEDWRRIQGLTARGLNLGGKTYYDPRALNEYLRQLGGPLGNEMRDFWGPAMAATSPQSALPVNLADASVLGVMQAQGVDLPTALTMYRQKFPHAPSPKFMQGEGADLLRQALQRGDPDIGTTRAQKVGSYSENLAGNVEPITADTHLSAISTFFHPDEAVRRRFGSRAMEDVTYGPFEQGFQQNVARPMGISPAQAQAGSWFGAGPLTGLISPWGDITQQLENQAFITARHLGVQPTQANLKRIIDEVLTGQSFFTPSYKRNAGLIHEVGYPTHLKQPKIK